MSANKSNHNKMECRQKKFMEKLIRETEQPVAGMLLKMTNDVMLIEDVMIATWTIACQKITVVENHENPHGWIMKTAKFQMLQALEKSDMRSQCEQKVLDKMKPYLEDGEQRELELKETLRSYLNEEEIKVVVLRYFYDIAYSELAEYFNCSEALVRKRVSRVVGKLRKIAPDIWYE